MFAQFRLARFRFSIKAGPKGLVLPAYKGATFREYESIPRPFVLEPPLETKREYLPGETLHFNLLLFGRAIQYLPYFIIVFREMGEEGLGKGRLPFTLEDVAASVLFLVWASTAWPSWAE
jgi:hypothetical protein